MLRRNKKGRAEGKNLVSQSLASERHKSTGKGKRPRLPWIRKKGGRELTPEKRMCIKKRRRSEVPEGGGREEERRDTVPLPEKKGLPCRGKKKRGPLASIPLKESIAGERKTDVGAWRG